LQQGRHIARSIVRELDGKPRQAFHYFDKGQLATIGRSRAILQSGRVRLTGFVAWWAWLFVHIYYLSGFQNRLLVLIQWAWSFVTFGRGARLIVEKSWRSYPDDSASVASGPAASSVSRAQSSHVDTPLPRASEQVAP
jgi:NADH dehydrogenase